MAQLVTVVSQWFYSDLVFLNWLFVVVILDTVSGIYKSVKLKEFDFKKFLSFVFEKFFAYGILLVLANAFDNIQIHNASVDVFSFVPTLIASGLFLREAYSILENIVQIRPELSSF